MGRRTGVLGGTFDPIHVGHLAVADRALRSLALDEVLLIPSYEPPHRAAPPQASPYHRFAMVALAAASEERLIASDLELVASGVSYTATTLRRLAAAGYERSQMFFITGADAFAEISTWKDSQDLFSLAHFVVISRPGTLVTRLAERLPALSGRMRRVDQTNANSGRHRDGDGDLSIFLIDAATPEVSSTDIRGRVQQGLAIDGLVPPAVARYIHQHELYALSRGVPAGTGRGSELA